MGEKTTYSTIHVFMINRLLVIPGKTFGDRSIMTVNIPLSKAVDFILTSFSTDITGRESLTTFPRLHHYDSFFLRFLETVAAAAVEAERERTAA